MKEEIVKEAENVEVIDKTKVADDELETKSSYYDEVDDRYKYVPYTVTSFAELEEIEKVQEKTGVISNLLGKFKAILDNVFSNDEVDDKASAVKKVTSEFNQRLQSTKEVEEKERDTGEGAVEKEVDKENDVFNSSFTVFKSADGSWRWSAIWSNKYRDNDNPPEILAEAAHLNFVKAVEVDKSYPYPDLQLWHYPAITWGKATDLAYDIDNGLVIACGDIYKGFEPVAEAIDAMPPDTVGVSHGMPIAEIERDPNDASVIVRYRSEEISVLPKSAAANKLTTFTILGETTMNLSPKEKSEDIKKWLGDDRFAAITQVADGMGKEAKEKDLEFKEKTEKVVDDVAKETEATETTANPEPLTPDPRFDDLRKEIVKEVYDPLAEAYVALLSAVVEIKESVDKLSASDEAKIAEKAEATPRISLSSLIAQSVIGNSEVALDGRTKAGRDKPKETPYDDDATTIGGPFGNVISDIINNRVGVKE